MNGTPKETQEASIDSSRSALEFLHRLLTDSPDHPPNLAGLLAELASAFAASAAGLTPLEGSLRLAERGFVSDARAEEVPPSWRDQPELIEKALHSSSALMVPRPAGGSWLLSVCGTAERGGWLLWLEDAGRTHWSAAEASALQLAGQTLVNRLTDEKSRPRWAAQLERDVRQQRLEAAAQLVRRLAHDFGNILTGILGFSELALTQQLSPNSPLHAYLTEVYRAAQNGAQYTNQLRLFARRQATNNRSCSLAAALAEEEKRLRPTLGAEVRLHVDLPPNLPAVALDTEPLRQLLGIVLDNAREAIGGPGLIHVSARAIEVSAAEGRELFGDVRPGPHLEIRIADTGSGLTPEARRQLFVEPFFTTRPRKKGFGLAIAYGIVSANRGGLDLLPRPEGGTLVRILLPQIVTRGSSNVHREKASALDPRSTNHDSRSTNHDPRSPNHDPRSTNHDPRERVLVVDDDPMILQLVTTTLERAGYRVQAVGNAETALISYSGATGDPFHLVLSDVFMPEVNGIDLARSLLILDANVRVLFMSGQVAADFAPQDFTPGRFELLPKPFRPDGLVRAVRSALDRSPAAATAAAPH